MIKFLENRLRIIVDEAITNNAVINRLRIIVDEAITDNAVIKSHTARLDRHEALLKSHSAAHESHRQYLRNLDERTLRLEILFEERETKLDTILEAVIANGKAVEKLIPVNDQVEDHEFRIKAVEYTMREHLQSKNPHK